MGNRCFYFGCWNRPGHYLHAPGGRSASDVRRIEYFGDHINIDGSLAPRKLAGRLVWYAMGATPEERQKIQYRGVEYPQGQFLRHELDTGFTAIQWWDRCQGDGRGACNSTILLEGKHSSSDMLAALKEHFPHVLANLEQADIRLVEVFP